MFKSILALSLLPLVLGQYGGGAPAAAPAATSSSSSAAASASSTSAGQILVQVGSSGGLTFNPSNIQASVGTLVTFVFDAEHSVTESSFGAPCTPSSGGFDSGITSGTTFSVNVTDASTPVYFFCKVPGHCGLGMVGTINAPSSGNGTNSAFVAAAKAIGGNEAAVTDTGFHTGGQGAIATAPPTSGTPSVSASATSGSASPTTSNTSGATQLTLSGGAGLLSLIAGLFAAL